MKSEGIVTPEDLVDFDEDSISKISYNLRRPGVSVPYLTPGSVVGATITMPYFIFGAKAQVKLIEL